jgi:hypothetical protein
MEPFLQHLGLGCGFDWTVVWTAVGSIGIIAGGVFAGVQFYAYNRNERVKNTLALMERFQNEIIHHITTVDNVRSGVVPKPDVDAFLKDTTGAYNYFDSVYELWKRNLIDKDLFFRQMSYVLRDAHQTLAGIITALGHPYDISRLSELSTEAAKYLPPEPSS